MLSVDKVEGGEEPGTQLIALFRSLNVVDADSTFEFNEHRTSLDKTQRTHVMTTKLIYFSTSAKNVLTY